MFQHGLSYTGYADYQDTVTRKGFAPSHMLCETDDRDAEGRHDGTHVFLGAPVHPNILVTVIRQFRPDPVKYLSAGRFPLVTDERRYNKGDGAHCGKFAEAHSERVSSTDLLGCLHNIGWFRSYGSQRVARSYQEPVRPANDAYVPSGIDI